MPPANNNFANATTITGPAGSVTPVSLDDATTEVGEPQSSAYAGLGPNQTVWYKWIPTVSCRAVFTPSYSDACVLAAWTGTTLAGLTEAGSVDTSTSLTGLMSFNAVAGTTYWLQAGTFGLESSGLMFGTSWASTPDGRVLVAFDDSPLEPDPTWTPLDVTNNLVSGIDIRRGRQTERDRTDTGTATVYVNDTTGLFDAFNTLGPYYGKLDGKQIMLQAWNPLDEEWVPQFRGFIDDYGYDINPVLGSDGKPIVANVQIECVDLFDYLGGYQLQPYPTNGDAPPVGSEGTVFYEDTAGTVDDRIIQLLAEAGIDSTMYVVFTGNVKVQETKYDPGDALLNALRDAADAEFPGIANIYVDKTGRFVFHGRYSRFDPVTVSGDAGADAWNFRSWKVGDGTKIAFDSDYAQARVLSYSRSRSEIINSAICYPRGIAEADIPGQVYEDATSIAAYGKHSWSATDLVISEGSTTGNTKEQETFLFGKLYVENQKNPGNRVKTLTIKSLPPNDPRGAATWGVLTGVDISDIVNVGVGYPGGTGIDATDFYCEGVTMRIRPLNPDYDLIELDLDVSPAEWSMDTHGVFA